jgi:hypothetical protein
MARKLTLDRGLLRKKVLKGSSKNLFSRAIGVVKPRFGSRTYLYVRLRFLSKSFLATHPDKRVFRGALK